jgi:hypothetical protein
MRKIFLLSSVFVGLFFVSFFFSCSSGGTGKSSSSKSEDELTKWLREQKQVEIPIPDFIKGGTWERKDILTHSGFVNHKYYSDYRSYDPIEYFDRLRIRRDLKIHLGTSMPEASGGSKEYAFSIEIKNRLYLAQDFDVLYESGVSTEKYYMFIDRIEGDEYFFSGYNHLYINNGGEALQNGSFKAGDNGNLLIKWGEPSKGPVEERDDYYLYTKIQ